MNKFLTFTFFWSLGILIPILWIDVSAWQVFKYWLQLISPAAVYHFLYVQEYRE